MRDVMKKYKTFGAIIAILSAFVLFPTSINAADIQDEIIYDIIVDRFNNGNQTLSEKIDLDDPEGYHGGDIQGIIDRLDGLVEKGFTTINLSSIFSNAQGGFHGYWIEDYYEVEPQFGTVEDLNKLIAEAHKRKLKVTLELVTNYVAKTHPFVTDNAHENWFKDVQANPVDSTVWLENVVQLDQSNKEVQQYLLDVATYWMDEVKIDGFTLHGVDQMDISFLETFTDALKKKNSSFILTGTTVDVKENLDDLYAIDSLDAIQNVEIMDRLVSVFQEPDNSLEALDDILLSDHHQKSLLMVDNKNVARFSNLVRDHGRTSVTSWKLVLAYLYMMPGTPVIYQGSEIPMYGPGYPENQMLLDPTGNEPDMEDVFKKYGSLRGQFQRFIKGDVEIVDRQNGLTLYKLTNEDEFIFVAINNDSSSNSVNIDGMSEDVQLRGLLHDDTIRKHGEDFHSIGLERESAEIFIVQPNTGFNWTFISLVAAIFLLFIGGVIGLTIKQKRREK